MHELFNVHINSAPSKLSVTVAFNSWQKMRGFLGKTLDHDPILFPSCRLVHTFGMKFPLDMAFIDQEGRVLRVKRDVKPGKIVWPVWGAFSIVEIPSAANTYKDIVEGVRLSFFKTA